MRDVEQLLEASAEDALVHHRRRPTVHQIQCGICSIGIGFRDVFSLEVGVRRDEKRGLKEHVRHSRPSDVDVDEPYYHPETGSQGVREGGFENVNAPVLRMASGESGCICTLSEVSCWIPVVQITEDIERTDSNDGAHWIHKY